MMEKRMRKIFAASVLLAAMTAAAGAMPLGPIDTTPSAVIQVAGGCGAGRHRGPYGGCLQNFANPAAHACPRGYHVGPGGGCRGNGR
jgi:hypothetical protein